MTLERKIAVIGLGYVGLPVAVAFARSGAPVIGFDINAGRVAELRAGHDRTREVTPEDLKNPQPARSPAIRRISPPRTSTSSPCRRRSTTRDGPISAPCCRRHETVGSVLKKRRHRGLRDRPSIPARSRKTACRCWSRHSRLVAGRDFTVGYSPERINPGDKAAPLRDHHQGGLRRRTQRTLDIVADVYGSVVKAGIHRAPSIKVAEAAKVIENTQRDLNIAFMNELSAIFHQLGIDTGEVLAAAAHQMEFPAVPAGPGRRPLHRRRSLLPDPPRARRPAIIRRSSWPAAASTTAWASASRANACARCCSADAANPTVTVLGMTFKENVPDIRNSKVIDIVRELERVRRRRAGARSAGARRGGRSTNTALR